MQQKNKVMKPLISAIMSVYNGSKFLEDSINSVLTQTFTNFEFIIIDDASTDSSFNILSKYVLIDSRIKVIRNEVNLGLTKSLNIALWKARGEYIARIDADDICRPERFAKEADFLDTNLSVGLVGSWADLIDEKGEIFGELKYPTESNIIRRDLVKYNPFIHSSIMIRRDILNQIGGYNEVWKYAQDYELYFRLSKICELANIPKILVSSRVSGKSITRSKNRKQILFAIRARIYAIRSGAYPFYCYIYLIKPIVGMIIGPKIKDQFKRLFFKS